MAIGTPVSLTTINSSTDATSYASGTVTAATFQIDDLIVGFVFGCRTTSDVETPTMTTNNGGPTMTR